MSGKRPTPLRANETAEVHVGHDGISRNLHSLVHIVKRTVPIWHAILAALRRWRAMPRDGGCVPATTSPPPELWPLELQIAVLDAQRRRAKPHLTRWARAQRARRIAYLAFHAQMARDLGLPVPAILERSE